MNGVSPGGTTPPKPPPLMGGLPGPPYAPSAFAELWRELEPIGRDPQTGGYYRYSWTPADAACRAWFTGQAERRGLVVETDNNGNLWAWWGPRRPGAVIAGRHLDCGSVASPYRETEAMADGSDAIADWPLLNALVNTASGASWVSIHHGGGVGIGRSIHAGQVTVADGTPLAAEKLARVLTNDPGMGVIRHVDAGYAHAAEIAARRGVRIPMRDDG